MINLKMNTDRSTATDTTEIIPVDRAQQSKTKYPTVWLGSSDGWLVKLFFFILIIIKENECRLYIHSAIDEHRKIIGKVWLRHAIYNIV